MLFNHFKCIFTFFNEFEKKKIFDVCYTSDVPAIPHTVKQWKMQTQNKLIITLNSLEIDIELVKTSFINGKCMSIYFILLKTVK